MVHFKHSPRFEKVVGFQNMVQKCILFGKPVGKELRTGSHKINLLDILTTSPQTSIAIV